MKKRFLALGLMAALASTEARAQVLLNDTFIGEFGGGTTTNYNSFANFTVTGAVDIIGQGNPYSLDCTGSCVDLAGSPGPGRLTTNPFAFSYGDVLRMTFTVSGNQRNSQFNSIQLGANFTGGAEIGNYSWEVAGVPGSGFGGAPLSGITLSTLIGGQTAFSTWSFQFEALGSGFASFFIGAPDANNVGPMLDDVMVERIATQSVVPEPSTYAMLALGLGAVAVAARRRNARA